MIFLKKRLDVLVFEKGLSDSREKAKTLIMSGNIYVNNQKYDKPGESIDVDCKIELRGKTLKYVSRGGLKLEKAMETFNLNLNRKICMDVGASTGGFTDCMLLNGASKVYSVDVGYGQLAWKLRNDNRVINLERKNARYLTNEEIKEEIEFVSVDVSFISLTLILKSIYPFIKENGELVCLIKPQFEAGKDKVGKKGVVKDIKTHSQVIEKIIDFSLSNGYSVLGLTYSPVKGPEGNIEYLIHLIKQGTVSLPESLPNVEEIVNLSHKELNV